MVKEQSLKKNARHYVITFNSNCERVPKTSPVYLLDLLQKKWSCWTFGGAPFKHFIYISVTISSLVIRGFPNISVTCQLRL